MNIPERKDLIIGALIVILAAGLIAGALYSRLNQSKSAKPLIPSPSHTGLAAMSASPSASPEPQKTEEQTEKKQDEELQKREAELKARQEKLEEAEKEKKKKLETEAKQEEAVRLKTQCLDNAEEKQKNNIAQTCRTLYDQYVRECDEQNCRTQIGWSADTILPQALSCCAQDAKKKLGISSSGPIQPYERILSCQLPPDAKSMLETSYQQARDQCEKLYATKGAHD